MLNLLLLDYKNIIKYYIKFLNLNIKFTETDLIGILSNL